MARVFLRSHVKEVTNYYRENYVKTDSVALASLRPRGDAKGERASCASRGAESGLMKLVLPLGTQLGINNHTLHH